MIPDPGSSPVPFSSGIWLIGALLFVLAALAVVGAYTALTDRHRGEDEQ